ncbi:MAG TPA: phage major capsid protein, partial [Acidimicrobiia bacterium]
PSEPAGSGRGEAPAGSGARSRENIQDDPMRGFRDAGDFAAAVREACMPSGDLDDRLRILGAPSNFHRETGSSDGYMVPPAVRDEVWRVAFADEGLLQQFAPEPTSGNQVQLFADESTPWGATGVQANWASEGNQFSPSRLANKGRTVQLHKLYAFVLATEELVADAARLASRLTLTAGQAINYKATDAIVNGDGVGKPLGYMDSGALVSVAKESGQAAATVVAANVAKMYSRLLMGQGGDAFWLTNQDVLPQLMTMTLGDQPIWTPPSSGFANAPGGFLMGRPIRFSEHCETLGTVGDVQLVNPRGYYAATKQGGVSFASSIHLYFDYDIEAFRWTFRLGGQPYLSAPVSPAKGSATKSHFVALANRS